MRYFKRGFTALVAIALMGWSAILPPVYAQVTSGPCGLRAVVPMASSGETLTVSSTAKILTASKYSVAATSTTFAGSANIAVIDIETDAIRWWDDTTVPTAAVGHKVAAGAQITVCGILAIRQFQMIRVTTDATATISYYRGE